MRLSPRDPNLYAFQFFNGFAYMMLGQYQQAIEWHRRSVASNPDYPDSQWQLAAALALAGDYAQAREALARYLSLPLTRNKTIAQLKAGLPTPAHAEEAAFLEHEVEGLRKAGMPEE
jgi:predicted Zn-dependent protease